MSRYLFVARAVPESVMSIRSAGLPVPVAIVVHAIAVDLQPAFILEITPFQAGEITLLDLSTR